MISYTFLTILVVLVCADVCCSFQQPNKNGRMKYIHMTIRPNVEKMKPMTSSAVYATDDKTKGVYSRPSAAIERGSGFYIPGLEGYRVRLLFGVTVLLLTVMNSLLGLGNSNVSAVELSQRVSVFFGILLLIQGSIELAKELGLGMPAIGGNTGTIEKRDVSAKALIQFTTDKLRMDQSNADCISWAALSFAALTPATHILVLENNNGIDQVIYGLGEFASRDFDENHIRNTLETVFYSKGGRVAVDESHSAAKLVPEGYRRCIIIQRVNSAMSKRCIVVASDQLLATFTKNDLKWLGAIAKYIQI